MLENPLPDEEVYAFKDFLNGIGDSIVLVADDELVKTRTYQRSWNSNFQGADVWTADQNEDRQHA